MKKYLLITILVTACSFWVKANIIVDDFSANIYAWNEGEIGDNIGTIQIIDGQLNIQSKHDEVALKTHCYAPINVEKNFRITAHVGIDKLKDDIDGFADYIINEHPDRKEEIEKIVKQLKDK